MRRMWILGVLAACSLTVSAQSLSEGFVNPPDSAKPHTWWHWMNGNITAAGISKDIHEMRRVGLGGAQIFNVDDGIPRGPVDYLTPQWRALFKHAVEEADKEHIELCFHNCAGWSSSGGPWVKPEQSMQQLVWTETRVDQPGQFTGTLPQPQTVHGFYRDIAVLAFPTPAAESHRLADARPTVTVGPAAPATELPLARLVDGNTGTNVQLAKPAAGGSLWVQLSFAEPFTARSLTMVAAAGRNGHRGELQVSDDGATFRRVGNFALRGDRVSDDTIAFPRTTAKFWRLLFTGFDARGRTVGLAEIALEGGVRIENWQAKAGFERIDNLLPAAGPVVDADAAVQRTSLLSLTDKLSAGGKLDWVVPAGQWTIMRLGHTSTGHMNAPAVEPGRGLEVDKLSREAADQFWKDGIEPILADCGPLVGKSLKDILIDSYEVGYQTWTDKFAAEFKQRRGYDPIPWLPAMTGRVVDGLPESERFLWDVRRTLADLFNDNYYGRFAERAHEHGMVLSNEPYGNGNFDNLSAGGKADIVMTEFWSGSGGDEGGGKMTSSVAHTYGGNLVGAESFTAAPENGAWRNDPWSLKALGDRMWCSGVNRFIFHRYAMQPWTDVRPGMTMSRWGFMFEWPITWWEQAPAWTGYLARCQYLLQAGRGGTDLLYFVGDSGQNNLPGRGGLQPVPPAGYDYDGADPVILNRLTVKEGKLTLPSGMVYAAVVLPPADAMLPATLRRVRELLTAGATVVVNTRPVRSPSLQDQPTSDEQVKALATELWGDCDGRAVKEHAVGRGRLVWGQPLDKVLADLKLPPDAALVSGEAGALRWIHRVVGSTDLYFVANWADHSVPLAATFRGAGRQPELWHGDTAKMEPAPYWHSADGLTTVDLTLEPRGSVFVVFAKPTTATTGPLGGVSFRGAATTAAKPSELVIEKAEYGAWPEAADRIDVTQKVRELVAAGAREIPATNTMAGEDPAQNVPKQLEVTYTLNGQKTVKVAEENTTVAIPVGATIDRARYGIMGEDTPAATVDVTKQLNDRIKEGRLTVTAGNELAGDPANLVVKQMRVAYRLDGKSASVVVPENATLNLPPAREESAAPQYEVAVGPNAKATITTWAPGELLLKGANGKERPVAVKGPQSQPVDGPWTVTFPPNWGAPPEVTLDKLISWPDHPTEGVKYFSGTAEYHQRITVPAAWLAAGRTVRIDLGRVKNFAELFLNGKSLGVLWKPPFVYDLTGQVKAGENDLRIQVTNLWPNRLIGDEQKPDDRKWGGDGRLLEWPKWVLEGKPKPDDGRYTWTTWRHYRADSPLLESGLIGPVLLQMGVKTPAP